MFFFLLSVLTQFIQCSFLLSLLTQFIQCSFLLSLLTPFIHCSFFVITINTVYSMSGEDEVVYHLTPV